MVVLNRNLSEDEKEGTEGNMEFRNGGTAPEGTQGLKEATAQQRTNPHNVARCVCSRHVTTFSASHWASLLNHVIQAWHINKGEEKALVRHFVDVGFRESSAGAGREASGRPIEGVWI